MSQVEINLQPQITKADREIAWSPDPIAPGARRPRRRILPLLITTAAAALAIGLGQAMWDAYMAAPWTRDGTVRAYVVAMAPEVAGRIIDLPVADNQFVQKGQLLMVIDPTDYVIAVHLAEAAVEQAKANAKNAKIKSVRRQKLTTLSITEEEKQSFATKALSADAYYRQAIATLDQARVNLQRTRILSPVNGYVTNLLAQPGDYATAGQNKMSLVNAQFILGRRVFRGNQSRANPHR